jgi:glutamate--glyoxylate aminotransferase
MADEVYQENTYDPARPFVSAKKVLAGLGEPFASSVELVSFHTVSKGSTGECGLRGGYMEAVNILPATMDELYKISSINLCPNTMGQAAVSLMVAGPPAGTEAAKAYEATRSGTIVSYQRRAKAVALAFNACEGVSCNATEGAMYAFPRLNLPPKALAAAKAAGKSPDTWYCLQLVEETGILTVPGSGFGQEPGTFHLRTTILPSEDRLGKMMADFAAFQAKLMDAYRE